MVAHNADLELVAATGPQARADRLVVVDPVAGGFSFADLSALPLLLRPGDLVVVNDAATLPASVGMWTRDGVPVELRLGRRAGPDRWWVAAMGEGTWSTPTESRGAPPSLAVGDGLSAPGLRAAVIETSDDPHWVLVELGPGWLEALYRRGEPVRYSYLGSAVPLRAFQTPFATRPWSSESPSAALPLTWSIVLGLRRAGVGVAALTHAAGLSSVDGGRFDERLPLPERADVPPATVDAVLRTRAAGGRVVAVGTTVVRALEGRVARRGRLEAGDEEVDLVFGGSERPAVVDGLLTKLHAPSESHFRVLTPFAPASLLVDAFGEAADRGFRNHEFGDSALVLGGYRPSSTVA